jgi:hypothetical protein
MAWQVIVKICKRTTGKQAPTYRRRGRNALRVRLSRLHASHGAISDVAKWTREQREDFYSKNGGRPLTEEQLICAVRSTTKRSSTKRSARGPAGEPLEISSRTGPASSRSRREGRCPTSDHGQRCACEVDICDHGVSRSRSGRQGCSISGEMSTAGAMCQTHRILASNVETLVGVGQKARGVGLAT